MVYRRWGPVKELMMAEMYNAEAWNKIAGLYQRIAALEAELERVTAERDARDHECHRLRDVLCDRNEDLAAAEARAVIAERERDAARAAAAALRKWGVTWRVIAWDSERFQQFRTFDNIQQMWATVRPDVEYGDSHND